MFSHFETRTNAPAPSSLVTAIMGAFNTWSLREATPTQQVHIFQSALSRPQADSLSLTHELLSYIASGSLSPVTIATWLTVTHHDDPLPALAALRQTHSAFARRIAIKHVRKHLRAESTVAFRQTWDSLGGATGVAELMAGFSVRSVRALCDSLGRTASAGGEAKLERQQAMTALLAILCPELGISSDPGYIHVDKRLLQVEY
jgi:hypothetical protein